MIAINLDLNKLTGDPILSFEISENTRSVDEKLLMRFAELARETGLHFLPIGDDTDLSSGDKVFKYEIRTNHVSNR